jgi:TetR/AcrR family transcriptional regulator
MPNADFQAPDAYSDTERQIFDAALEVFARKGKDGARMQAIADRADINKAMLHYYFRSKDQLYDQVFGFTMRRFMASFGASLREAPTFAETLRAFIDGYITFIRDNEHAMRLMLNENLSGGSALGRHLKRIDASDAAPPPKVLVERIEAAIEAGEIRAVDPQHTVLSVISLCIFFFAAAPTVRVIHPDADADWNAFLDARKEHVFDLVYRGLAPN